MTKSTLMDRIAALPRNRPGEHAPPPELVAFCVMTSRGLRNWKQSTLADFAGVSLSTVERVERGERVRPTLLDRVGVALGHEPGYFTHPRRELSPEEAADSIVESWGHLVPVSVGPINTQPGVRRLVRGHCLVMHSPDCPDDIHPDIRGLAEWLDLGSFLFSDLRPTASEEIVGRRREFYRDVLQAVTAIETQGFTVLGGTLTDTVSNIPDWRVTILSITPRTTDPGAPKRRTILVDRRNWSNPLQSVGYDSEL